jgi:hypothetical protein
MLHLAVCVGTAGEAVAARPRVEQVRHDGFARSRAEAGPFSPVSATTTGSLSRSGLYLNPSAMSGSSSTMSTGLFTRETIQAGGGSLKP